MRRIYAIMFVFMLPLCAATSLTDVAFAQDRIDKPASHAKPLFGPILSKDPATRIQIKDLYLEINEFRLETHNELSELNQTYRNESNANIRQKLARKMGELKRSLEIRNMEIGLEIALLNGQKQRADEFELALDQILNPEKYFPANRPDPALKATRLREHGQK